LRFRSARPSRQITSPSALYDTGWSPDFSWDLAFGSWRVLPANAGIQSSLSLPTADCRLPTTDSFEAFQALDANASRLSRAGIRQWWAQGGTIMALGSRRTLLDLVATAIAILAVVLATAHLASATSSRANRAVAPPPAAAGR
jgi:hypothetical protein